MDRVVLDTDVSSLSLKRRLPPQVLARLVGKQPCVTFVTVGELTQWEASHLPAPPDWPFPLQHPRMWSLA
jgi:hypothetical protein